MNSRQLIRTLLASFLLLSACGEESTNDKRPTEGPLPGQPPSTTPAKDAPQGAEAPSAPAAADDKAADGESPAPSADAPEGQRKFSEQELMTLVGLSTSESQSAYGHCRDVLAQGIYDRYRENVSDTVKHALVQQFCAMAEDEFADKVQQYFNEGRSSSSSGSHSDSFGFGYGAYLDLELATSGSSSGSSSQTITRAQATDTVRKWKTAHCGSSNESRSSDFEHTVFSEQIDSNVIAAWRACIAKASHGFFCESSETEDTVSIRMHWEPNAVQAALLPRLELRQQTAHNLELASTEVPATVGTGTGVSVTYRRIDPKKVSIFEAQGSDPYQQVDFNCSIQVKKVVRGQVKRDEFCGIESYRSGRGEACGVASFNLKRGKVCGDETYKTKASAACGVKSYKQKTDPACPGYVAPDTLTRTSSVSDRCITNAPSPEACPTGYLDRGVSESTRQCRARLADSDWTQVYQKTRTCQRAEFVPTCRLPAFGVESYKTCAHKSHGVQTYKQCRHESFGVESYKTCQNEAFGKIFRACFVPEE